LCRAALSASGVAVQGRHLIDPRTGAPARRLTRAWSLADTAARADALSTAFFVFDDAEVDHFCRADPAIGAMLASSDGTLRCYGRAADLFRPSGPGGVLVA
jgi:thiamine biosynthesis lipoprotein